jgi:hypothetical protein
MGRREPPICRGSRRQPCSREGNAALWTDASGLLAVAMDKNSSKIADKVNAFAWPKGSERIGGAELLVLAARRAGAFAQSGRCIAVRRLGHLAGDITGNRTPGRFAAVARIGLGG